MVKIRLCGSDPHPVRRPDGWVLPTTLLMEPGLSSLPRRAKRPSGPVPRFVYILVEKISLVQGLIGGGICLFVLLTRDMGDRHFLEVAG